jgi:hypothetical protein
MKKSDFQVVKVNGEEYLRVPELYPRHANEAGEPRISEETVLNNEKDQSINVDCRMCVGDATQFDRILDNSNDESECDVVRKKAEHCSELCNELKRRACCFQMQDYHKGVMKAPQPGQPVWAIFIKSEQWDHYVAQRAIARMGMPTELPE